MAWGDQGGIFGSLTDPSTMALLSAMQGVGQYAGSSRLPITTGEVLGGLGGGLLGGIRAGQQYQLGQEQQTAAALANAQALDQLRMWQAGTGGGVPSLTDLRKQIRSGTWQGTPESVILRWLQGGGLYGGAGQQGNPPQISQAGGDASQASGPAPAVPNASSRLSGGQTTGMITDTLSKLGYSPTDQAAVLGNAAWESSLNPANTSGDKGTSIGLWQWHSDDRKAGLMRFAQETGRDWSDPSVQAEYMDRELRDRAPEFFDPNKSLAEKTKIFQDKFEVPAQDTSKQRTQLAQNFAGGTFSDVGGAGAGQGALPGGAGGFSLSSIVPNSGQMMFNTMFKKHFGYPLTQFENDMFSASQYPAGSPMQTVAVAGALKNAGIPLFIPGERANVPGRQLVGFGPNGSPRYGIAYQNPGTSGLLQDEAGNLTLPQQSAEALAAREAAITGGQLPAKLAEKGRQLGPTGISPLPGAIRTEQAEATARALGPATFAPQTYTDLYGRAFLGSQAQLPNIGGFGVGMPAVGTPTGARTPPPVPAGTQDAAGASQPSPAATVAPQQPAAAAPSPSQRTESGAPIPTRPESAPPTFPVQTPAGTKDISQVTVDDMFPGGAGVPRLPTPPGGLGYAPQKEGGEIAKDNNEQLMAYSKEASENQKVYQDLAHLREVLQRGLSTGKLLPLAADMANIAHSVGADAIIPKGWNPSDANVFNKAGTDLIFAAVKKLAGQVRVAEIQGYAQASPNMTITPEANFQIINDLLSAGKWQDMRAKLGAEFITQYPNTPMAIFNDRYNRMAPLADVTDRYKSAMMALAPKPGETAVKFPGQPGPESQANPRLTAPVDTRTYITDPQTGKTTWYRMTKEGWRPEQ